MIIISKSAHTLERVCEILINLWKYWNMSSDEMIDQLDNEKSPVMKQGPVYLCHYILGLKMAIDALRSLVLTLFSKRMPF